MSRTDLIADALTIIRNGVRAGKEDVSIPYSRMLENIMSIFKREDYIDNFKVIDTGSIKKIKVYLRYTGKKSAIAHIKKISRSGRRIYVDKKNIPDVLSGYGTAVVSTSKGIMSNTEAKEAGVGGEVICYIW